MAILVMARSAPISRVRSPVPGRAVTGLDAEVGVALGLTATAEAVAAVARDGPGSAEAMCGSEFWPC